MGNDEEGTAYISLYPSRPMRIVVGIPAGNPSSSAPRCSVAIGEAGQQSIVENRPGAAGNTGTELLAARITLPHFSMSSAMMPFCRGSDLFVSLRISFALLDPGTTIPAISVDSRGLALKSTPLTTHEQNTGSFLEYRWKENQTDICVPRSLKALGGDHEFSDSSP
jgi:hypothetical protein